MIRRPPRSTLFPTRRSSDLVMYRAVSSNAGPVTPAMAAVAPAALNRSEEHTSELQSLRHLVCRLLLGKKKTTITLTRLGSLKRPHTESSRRKRATLSSRQSLVSCIFFFFFNDTATTEIYTLSLHDALPILLRGQRELLGLLLELLARELDLL